MTGAGKTLMVYNSLNGASQMFCATNAGVFNVTASGAVGSPVATRTNGKHQWTMFGDGTNNWLIACNGVDKPLYYNGTTWTAVDNATTPALTGVDSTRLVSVNVFKGRLFFVEKDSLKFWYLPAGAAGGTLVSFDLSAEAKRGGYLVAMGSWTRDAGDGLDDVAVFVTSEGEAIVYQGNNPASSSSWAKVGTYFIGRPLGRRCLLQYGGDLVVITENGTFPLSAAVQTAAIDYKMALTFFIEPAFTEAARTYGAVFGWRAIVFPPRNALIVNVPYQEDGAHYQFVMNTVTKAWCRFTNWNAEDFAFFNGALYFTEGTKVKRAWHGTSDSGANIVAYAKTAFTDFGSRLTKHVKMMQPLLGLNEAISFLADIDVDFRDSEIVGVANYTSTSESLWDTAKWDEGVWGGSTEIVRQWITPSDWTGTWIAGKIKIATNKTAIQWMATNYMFEVGGQL